MFIPAPLQQLVDTEDESLQMLRFSNGSVVRQAKLGSADLTSEPALRFFEGAGAVSTWMEKLAELVADSNLSESGRAKQLEPLAKNVLFQVAIAWTGIAEFKSHIDERHARLVAVPSLEQSDIVGALLDGEIRSEWRGMTVPERAAWLVKFDAEPTPENARIELAIMRGPIGAGGMERKAIEHNWRRAQYAANPAETVAINAGRQLHAWAERGLLQVGGVLLASVDRTLWSSARILNTVLACENARVRKGYGVFGFSEAEALEAERQLKQRKAAGVA